MLVKPRIPNLKKNTKQNKTQKKKKATTTTKNTYIISTSGKE